MATASLTPRSISKKAATKSTVATDATVSFGSVTICWFPVAIGDNPACREGCPVRLGDELLWKEKMMVDKYESTRGDRLQGNALYLQVHDRAAVLLSNGYTLEDIVRVVIEIEEVKKSRLDSLKLNSREKLSLAMDSAGKTLRKIVRNSKPEKPNSVQARMA